MAQAAPIIGLVLQAGAMTYSAITQDHAANEARKQQDEQMKQQKAAQDAVLGEQQKQTALADEQRASLAKQGADAKLKSDAEAADLEAIRQRDTDRARQKASRGQTSGRSGTILTAPSGNPDDQLAVAGKTLLGG